MTVEALFQRLNELLLVGFVATAACPATPVTDDIVVLPFHCASSVPVHWKHVRSFPADDLSFWKLPEGVSEVPEKVGCWPTSRGVYRGRSVELSLQPDGYLKAKVGSVRGDSGTPLYDQDGNVIGLMSFVGRTATIFSPLYKYCNMVLLWRSLDRK